MRHALPLSLVIACTFTLEARLAGADPGSSTAAEAAGYGFGVRVGGYGFRNPEGDRRNAWDDCRMNGIGAFGQRRFGGHAFIEAGADLYFAESWPFELAWGEQDMDRSSALFTVAGGMRMFPRATVSPYVQLGAGLELTRVAMHAPGGEARTQAALPVGFVGVGGDLRVHPRLLLGMNLRAHVMGHFPHDHAHDAPIAEPPAHLHAEPEVAAQMQFYARYDL